MSDWTIEKLPPTTPRQTTSWAARRVSDGLVEVYPTREQAERAIIRRQRDEAGHWDIGHRDAAVDQEMSRRHG